MKFYYVTREYDEEAGTCQFSGGSVQAENTDDAWDKLEDTECAPDTDVWLLSKGMITQLKKTLDNIRKL